MGSYEHLPGPGYSGLSHRGGNGNGGYKVEENGFSQPKRRGAWRNAAQEPAQSNNAAIEMAEEDNDAIVQALLGSMQTFNRKNRKMGIEIREQNAFLDKLGGTFISAQESLRRTMKRLDQIGWGSHKHMWILFVFAFLVCIFIYLLLKFKR